MYFADNPEYKGKFSVPVLYDKEGGRIVNNESGDIIEYSFLPPYCRCSSMP